MRRWCICVMVCASTAAAPGAFERQPESVRAIGMGGAGVALPAGAWGAFTNPAALAGDRRATVAIGLTPSPFGLEELSRTAIAGVAGWGRFGASLAALRAGSDLYRETTIAAACGYDAGGGMCWGAACTLNSLSIEGYGSAACWGCDAGMLWRIAPLVSLGASAANMNSPSPGRSGEGIARTVTAGLAVGGGSPFTVAFDMAVDPRFPLELRLGGECVLAGCLAVRAGVTSDPSALCAGVGLTVAPFEVDYAFSRHQELGFTHAFGLQIHFDGP